jgi:siderophore synthetase component
MWAVPLASVRTLRVEHDGFPFLVKTDLPLRVGFTRNLRRSSIMHIRDVMRALLDIDCPSYSGVMPETISISLRTTDAAGVALDTGCVYREFAARPHVGEPRWLIPYFSLYSRGPRGRQEPSLLCQLVEHNRRDREDQFDTFYRIVLAPLIDSVAYLVVEHGLLPEAHEQNTFLEMDHLGQATRVIHSDLQDWNFDREIREARGLPCDFARNDVTVLDPCVEGPADALAYPARQIRYSSLFDFVLGRMLARCAIALSRYPNCRWHRIKAAARERLAAGLGDLGRVILPNGVAFRRSISENSKGKVLHIQPIRPPYR